jgi:hypothetical protein
MGPVKRLGFWTFGIARVALARCRPLIAPFDRRSLGRHSSRPGSSTKSGRTRSFLLAPDAPGSICRRGFRRRTVPAPSLRQPEGGDRDTKGRQRKEIVFRKTGNLDFWAGPTCSSNYTAPSNVGGVTLQTAGVELAVCADPIVYPAGLRGSFRQAVHDQAAIRVIANDGTRVAA